jgi:hypothetical protein
VNDTPGYAFDWNVCPVGDTGIPDIIWPMRQQEIERRLRRALRFPRAWFTTGLMTGELMRLQFSSLRRRYGTRSRPVRSSEHWRYGAFLYCLRKVKDEAELKRLMLAARDDPDGPMAKAMMSEMAAHHLYSQVNKL